MNRKQRLEDLRKERENHVPKVTLEEFALENTPELFHNDENIKPSHAIMLRRAAVLVHLNDEFLSDMLHLDNGDNAFHKAAEVFADNDYLHQAYELLDSAILYHQKIKDQARHDQMKELRQQLNDHAGIAELLKSMFGDNVKHEFFTGTHEELKAYLKKKAKKDKTNFGDFGPRGGDPTVN